jgi:hypothetical protein
MQAILVRTNHIHKTDLITHDFCVQGSTYDHLVPPLSSVLNTSIFENELSNNDEGSNIDSNDAASLTIFTALIAVICFWLTKC